MKRKLRSSIPPGAVVGFVRQWRGTEANGVDRLTADHFVTAQSIVQYKSCSRTRRFTAKQIESISQLQNEQT
ncbi:MAG: hypothetical protein DMF02_03710 [Verrucomicrobia bacterium]|nr:MAG: hypothetical protein DMF02_03710 [Verrucomicrobiota bacterium]